MNQWIKASLASIKVAIAFAIFGPLIGAYAVGFVGAVKHHSDFSSIDSIVIFLSTPILYVFFGFLLAYILGLVPAFFSGLLYAIIFLAFIRDRPLSMYSRSILGAACGSFPLLVVAIFKPDYSALIFAGAISGGALGVVTRSVA